MPCHDTVPIVHITWQRIEVLIEVLVELAKAQVAFVLALFARSKSESEYSNKEREHATHTLVNVLCSRLSRANPSSMIVVQTAVR